MKKIFIIFLFAVATQAIAQEQKQVLVPTTLPTGFQLNIQVKGLRAEKGFMLYVQIQDEAQKVLQRTRLPVITTEMKVSFEKLPKGKYAVSLFQDENGNKKIDSNFIGIPTEGWGYSNDARGNMSAPTFSDQLFEISGNKIITINVAY